MAVLIVHGGAGAPSQHEHAERQAAVERALDAGWAAMGGGVLDAVQAAVRHLEDEPMLNAGVGASLNRDGEIELDAGVMEGTKLRAGAVGAVRDVRHPVDLARAVMEDGRHVLLVADGASRFAREQGVETCDPSVFLTERQHRNWAVAGADTVGAVARDDEGRTAVAVSTGGMPGKLPGRLGDSPLPGAGFYADDTFGVACGTGVGEGYMRLCLCHLAVLVMGRGQTAEQSARAMIGHLASHVDGSGGIILIDAAGRPAAAHSTPFMAWAQRTG
jgi:L-asparaginase / beta-aspartyl-peptidase